MIKRFFLDGVDMFSYRLAIGMRHQDAVNILSDTTTSKMTGHNRATMSTKIAGDAMIFIFRIKKSLNHHRAIIHL